MCGIYGYIGNKSIEEVMKGIKRLEYRGYDSAGIAFQNCEKLNEDENTSNGENITVIKNKGEIANLEKIVFNKNLKSEVSIGHTRWATHGEPSIKNSHPHLSNDGKWAIVHNGIIENYLDLKQEMQIKTASETDTEVVACLFEKYYNGHILSTIKNVCDKLKGSFAFAIITSYSPDKIFVAKRNSPVVLGYGNNYSVVCSDINSIKGKNIYVLGNDQFAILEKGNISIFDKDLTPINVSELGIIEKAETSKLGDYAHYMLKEIDEIPLAIKRTVKVYGNLELLQKVLPKNKFEKFKNILVIGCGTAYHAGLVGKRLFEEEGLFCESEIASEFRYKPFVEKKNTLAIFVSQSGETADTISALKLCKQKGLKTLAITNVKNSSITFAADYCIYTNAGSEIGVASTKAYNCQLAIFYILSKYFNYLKNGNEKNFDDEIKNLRSVANLIKGNDIKPKCRYIAQKIHKSKSIYMIGRGLDFNIAQEASLKLKEISYIHCEAYPAGELKHGTISLIDKNTFIFAFVTQEKIKDKTFSNINEVVAREGKVILLSPFDNSNKKVCEKIKVPKINERYYPLFIINYLQLISYYTALLLGNNPDKPRSLAKSVTVE